MADSDEWERVQGALRKAVASTGRWGWLPAKTWAMEQGATEEQWEKAVRDAAYRQMIERNGEDSNHG